MKRNAETGPAGMNLRRGAAMSTAKTGCTMTAVWAMRHVRKSLSPTERHVLHAFFSWMNADGFSAPGINGLVRETGYQRRTVQLAVDRLEAVGVISMHAAQTRDRCAVYEVHVDRIEGAEEPAPLHARTRDVSRLQRKSIYQRDGYACRYCRMTDDLTLDHILPRRLGGAHALDNLVTACRSCNSRKGPRTPEQAGMTLLEVPR